MRTSSDLPHRTPRTSRRFRIGVLVAIVVLIVVLSTAKGLAGFYTDYLWFQEVHFTSVFTGVLVTKILLAVVFCAVFFALMMVSLTVADRLAPVSLHESVHDELVERYRDSVAPHGRLLRVVVSAVFALFAGIGTNSEWNNWILFRNRVDFPASDPLFHRNVAFYVFDLPFIRFLLGWGFGAVVVILIVTAVAQYLNGGIRFQGPRPRVTPAVKTHLSILLGALALIQAVSYYYDRFALVLSTSHLVDGATDTDVHANLPADDLLIVIAIIAAVLFLVNTRVRGWALPVVAVGVWGLVWIVAGNVYPALYQALRVNPSELSRETPYIRRNIEATREAYGLNDVKVVTNFDGRQTVTASAISGDSPQAVVDRETIANVQLLDPGPLVNTFEKLQALRTYYSINSLSVGRYDLDIHGQDALTETLTGVRELNTSVPSGFVNSKLIYTHGYGAVVAPATEEGVDGNGAPKFSLQNVPPSGTPALSSTGSQVYYGEGDATGGFVIADSAQEELDYQNNNNQDVYTHYAGSGGVPIANIFRRLAFAVNFSNLDILLSGQVTDKSRIIYNRNIVERVEKAAPFLKYDAHPYATIVDGQIYWIIDAYTTTANYPYSQDADTARVPAASGLSGTFNYVRNSVKVVINAYTGKMDFFVVDPSDPIIQAYMRAFPDLFIPGSKADSLIPGITSQFRYPEDLFEVQTNMYGRYHLTNPAAFYTEANAWNISQQPATGAPGSSNTQYAYSATGQVSTSVEQLDPQYEVAAEPGSNAQSFVILQPFVPYSPSSSRQNLTAVMFASSDSANYGDGQLTVYETPPSENINGPELITTEINENTAISSQFSLLDQHGSQVELGQVVVVPIANTLMYVQPVYVQSSTNHVPELKNVIVVYNNNAYQSGNASIDAALCQIGAPFTSYCSTAAANRPTNLVNASKGQKVTSPPASSPVASGSVAALLDAATNEFAAAKTALEQGDLGTYQSDVAAAEADVAKARGEAASSSGSSGAGRSKSTTSTTGGAGG